MSKSKSEPAMSDPSARQIAELEDFAWALQRVQDMRDGALIDAKVYGVKLLKGFGYPNETFSRAQDGRALTMVLAALTASEARPPQQAELDNLFAIGDEMAAQCDFANTQRLREQWEQACAALFDADVAAAEARGPQLALVDELVTLVRRWLEASEDEFFDRLYGAQADARALLDRIAARGPAPQEPPQDDIKMWNTPKSDQTGVVFDAAVDGPRVADLNEQAEYQRGVCEGLEQAAERLASVHRGLGLEAQHSRDMVVAIRLTHLYEELRQRAAGLNGLPTDPAGGPPRSASAPEGVK